jgi:hypothetical protein
MGHKVVGMKAEKGARVLLKSHTVVRRTTRAHAQAELDDQDERHGTVTAAAGEQWLVMLDPAPGDVKPRVVKVKPEDMTVKCVRRRPDQSPVPSASTLAAAAKTRGLMPDVRAGLGVALSTWEEVRAGVRACGRAAQQQPRPPRDGHLTGCSFGG